MAHNFKVGDWVKVQASGIGCYGQEEGRVIAIDETRPWPITVLVDDYDYLCRPYELEIIEPDHGEFLVLCPWDGGQDHITYTNLSKATEVAESRAASWPGKEFTVYRAVSRSVVTVLPVETTPL